MKIYLAAQYSRRMFWRRRPWQKVWPKTTVRSPMDLKRKRILYQRVWIGPIEIRWYPKRRAHDGHNAI